MVSREDIIRYRLKKAGHPDPLSLEQFAVDISPKGINNITREVNSQISRLNDFGGRIKSGKIDFGFIRNTAKAVNDFANYLYNLSETARVLQDQQVNRDPMSKQVALESKASTEQYGGIVNRMNLDIILDNLRKFIDYFAHSKDLEDDLFAELLDWLQRAEREALNVRREFNRFAQMEASKIKSEQFGILDFLKRPSFFQRELSALDRDMIRIGDTIVANGQTLKTHLKSIQNNPNDPIGKRNQIIEQYIELVKSDITKLNRLTIRLKGIQEGANDY